MPEAKNGYKKLFDKLLYAAVVALFTGVIGIGVYNFKCDAQREAESEREREKLECRQEKKVEKLREEIKEDITEIKESQREMKREFKNDMKELKELVRAIK